MKKKYIKPVIETEEFVANEYCQSCFEVSCVDHPDQKFRVSKEPTDGITDFDPRGFSDDGFDMVYSNGKSEWYYVPQNEDMPKFTCDPIKVPVYQYVGYKITYVKREGDGPNAS